MKIRNLCFSLFGILCVYSSLAPDCTAAPVCTEDGSICLQASLGRNGREVDFWLSSSRVCPVTVSTELRGTNILSLDSAPVVSSLPRAGNKKVFTRSVGDTGKPWDLSFRFYAQCGTLGARHSAEAIYDLPISPGHRVRVSQGFRGAASHQGVADEYAVDFELAENTPVFAAREGVVVEVVQKFGVGGPRAPEREVNVVRVEHADHTVGEYAHLRREGAAVVPGQRVKRGELLAYSGNSGKSGGPHLHFAVHVPISGKVRRSLPVLFWAGGKSGEELRAGQEYRKPTLSSAANFVARKN